MSRKDEIRRVVIDELEQLAPEFSGKIRDSDRPIPDLKLTGDDASAFAIETAKRLGIKVPRKAWSTVYTVADAIALLQRYDTKGDSG